MAITATAALGLMTLSFWAINVLPLAVFLLVTVVFAILASGRPEATRHHTLLTASDPSSTAPGGQSPSVRSESAVLPGEGQVAEGESGAEVGDANPLAQGGAPLDYWG